MIPGRFHLFDQRPAAIKDKDYATTPIASGYDKEDSRRDYSLDAFKANPKIAARLLNSWREWNTNNAAFIPWWRDKGVIATASADD